MTLYVTHEFSGGEPKGGGGTEVACGGLADRWGVFWQVMPARLMELVKDPDRDRARRAMEAMIRMIMIDIATVERAANGV